MVSVAMWLAWESAVLYSNLVALWIASVGRPGKFATEDELRVFYNIWTKMKPTQIFPAHTLFIVSGSLYSFKDMIFP